MEREIIEEASREDQKPEYVHGSTDLKSQDVSIHLSQSILLLHHACLNRAG